MPAPTPPWLRGSLIYLIVNTSSAIFLIVFQHHVEIAPRMAVSLVVASGIVKHTTEPDFSEGEEPSPDEARLNSIDLEYHRNPLDLKIGSRY